MPSTPSAEPGADEAFRARRVDRLRRRRPRPSWVAWAAAIAVALVAVAITSSRSQPEDTLASDAAKVEGAAAPRQGGTGCVGWPLDLTPTGKPAPRVGAVSLWGDRDAFHFRNVGNTAVVVEVRSEGGALRPVEHDAEQVGDDHLRFELGPNSEGRFTAACAATALAFSGTDAQGQALGAGAFQLGSGPADAPLSIDKVVRR